MGFPPIPWSLRDSLDLNEMAPDGRNDGPFALVSGGYGGETLTAAVLRGDRWIVRRALQGPARAPLPAPRSAHQEHNHFASWAIGDDGSVTVVWDDEWYAVPRENLPPGEIPDPEVLVDVPEMTAAHEIRYSVLAPNATRWSAPKRVALFPLRGTFPQPTVIGLSDGAAAVWTAETRRANVTSLVRIRSTRPLRPTTRTLTLPIGRANRFAATTSRVPGSDILVSVMPFTRGPAHLAATDATGSRWTLRSRTALPGFRRARVFPGLVGRVWVRDGRRFGVLEVR